MVGNLDSQYKHISCLAGNYSNVPAADFKNLLPPAAMNESKELRTRVSEYYLLSKILDSMIFFSRSIKIYRGFVVIEILRVMNGTYLGRVRSLTSK